MTSKTASLKLPVIVRETVLEHLSQLANPANAADFLAFTSLTQQIKAQGIEIIWDKKKSKIQVATINIVAKCYAKAVCFLRQALKMITYKRYIETVEPSHKR